MVVDASIAACWAFRDEDHPNADLALARLRTTEAVVPAFWWFEVRNILVVNERRQRITEAETAVFLRDLTRLPISIDRVPDSAKSSVSRGHIDSRRMTPLTWNLRRGVGRNWRLWTGS
jgi:predicted nucleic acid-binding protein